MKSPVSPAACPLTCGHEEGDAEFAAEHPRAQVLQGAPIKGQGPAHQHVQHHAEALHTKQTELNSSSGLLAPPHRQNTGCSSQNAALEMFLWKTLYAVSGLFSKTCTEHSGSKAKQTEQNSDQSQRERGSSHTQISTFGPSYSLPSKSSGAA